MATAGPVRATWGLHTVCAVVTEEFLDFSRERGNDLITPHPEWDFPGLKPGDKWCVCVSRWQEALESGKAPLRSISPRRTHPRWNLSRFEELRAHAYEDVRHHSR